MIIGFTGSRAGMTPAQRDRVHDWLKVATEAHHGDCVGADEQFHELCVELGVPVVLHPPKDSKQRAWCEGAKLVLQERPYLVRNKDIVQVSNLMLATPKETSEPQSARGQGTWSTIRYARKQGAKLMVYMPDGSVLDGA